MNLRLPTPIKVIALVALGLIILAGIAAAAMPKVKEWIKADAKDKAAAEKQDKSVALDPTDPDTLRFVLPAAKETLGVRTTEVKKSTQPRLLELNGSLAPDTDKLLPVRSRFPGEVMEIGKVADRTAGNQTTQRDVGNGDLVEKDQLLAVVWSKDLGLTKSQLLDALSKLRLDKNNLAKLEELYRKGAVPERTVREAERNVEADRIAVTAAELTLRSWRLNDKEIQTIHEEAGRLAQEIAEGKRAQAEKTEWEKWARVEVRAPFDGTILEKNVALGAIVDTTTNLFIIGDLSHLSVLANVYEEDLPTLQALPRPIPWTVHLKNDPTAKPLKGFIREIRPIIDPTQHAALVKGRVANPEGRLLCGQFITATVEIPPTPGEVVIPTTALIEDGQESIVFVQPDPKALRYTLRHVAVARRGRDLVYLRNQLTSKEEKAGLKPLQPGELVVTAGALEMRAALKDLQDAAKTTEKK
jgi:cobalt-zinc-cadmium efflux system membrane fusion protein